MFKMLHNFESKVLRRIFGSKKDEVAGSWKIFRNELHNLYSSTDIMVIGAHRQNSATMFLTRVSPAPPLGVCWLC
jgi:hypothetical protein